MNFLIALVLSFSFSYAKDVPTKKAKASRLPASSEESQLVNQFPSLKTDCEDLDILPLALQGQASDPFEMVASCTSSCGQGGCPYSVFVKGEKGFRQIGEFSGNYDVLKTKTKGYFDIHVTGSVGTDTKQDFTLKFNGTQYQ